MDSRGAVLLVNREPGKAIVEYRTAIVLDPNRAEAYDNLGVALLKVGDTNGAERQFEMALTINPNLTLAADHLKRLRRQKEIR